MVLQTENTINSVAITAIITGVSGFISILLAILKCVLEKKKLKNLGNKLNKYSYTLLDDNDFECSICLVGSNTNLIKLTCDHVFHKKCMVKWLEIGKACPLCRNIDI